MLAKLLRVLIGLVILGAVMIFIVLRPWSVPTAKDAEESYADYEALKANLSAMGASEPGAEILRRTSSGRNELYVYRVFNSSHQEKIIAFLADKRREMHWKPIEVRFYRDRVKRQTGPQAFSLEDVDLLREAVIRD